jgi:aspartate/glutamate racemase
MGKEGNVKRIGILDSMSYKLTTKYYKLILQKHYKNIATMIILK